ncbi:unnamed protein product [Effrenium voratum]|uniref:Amine oxidase domain-containing protein n=1 Tax=Effrenium voratum TaxID=2562239 RepID=A0AA36NCP4_9DINO|nr:unnamed protein product [Effrenium voratum]
MLFSSHAFGWLLFSLTVAFADAGALCAPSVHLRPVSTMPWTWKVFRRAEAKDSPRANMHVAVVGAGVAGLACARALRRSARVEVFEAAEAVGGRVKTDRVPLPGRLSGGASEGSFLLDHGFQILIEAYPEVKRLDLKKRLKLRGFAPGAYLAFGGGELRIVADPSRSPRYLWRTVASGIASFWDILALGMLRLRQVFLEGPYAALEREGKASSGQSTEAFLRSLGLSRSLVDRFLRPFFEAIYVTPLKAQSAACFQFVLRMLAEGNSSLPEGGMQALPEHLAEGLELHLGAPVEQLHAGGDSDLERPALRLRGEGGVRGFDAVVLATDGPAARRLLPELPELPKTASCTWYFAVPGASMPVTEPLIVLNSTDQVEEDGLRLVNVGFPSLVQRSYAPVGWHLAAVTLRNGQGEEGWVRRQLADLFGRDVGDWQLLKVYRIPFHQPGQFPSQLWPPRDPRPSLKGIYLCGDFLAEPTLDSALRSGRRAAEAVLSDAK